MVTEQIIRYVDLTQVQRDQLQIATTIENARPVKPKRIESPTWLAISYVVHPERGELYILYFLSADGRPIDFAQRQSLITAMEEVAWVVQRSAWRVCSLVLNEDWECIPRKSIA